MVVAVFGGIVWLFAGLTGLVDRINTLPRFTIPGRQTLHLSPGTYHLYVEYPSASFDPDPARAVGTIEVSDPAHQAVTVSPSLSVTYSFGDHEGRSVAQFTADQRGDYTISAEQPDRTLPSGIVMATAKGGIIDPSSVASTLVLPFVLGGVALLIGLVLLIATIVRRSRWRRAQHPWGPGGPQGPYGGFGYAPSGYPVTNGPTYGSTAGPGGQGVPGYGPPAGPGGQGVPGYGPPAGPGVRARRATARPRVLGVRARRATARRRRRSGPSQVHLSAPDTAARPIPATGPRRPRGRPPAPPRPTPPLPATAPRPRPVVRRRPRPRGPHRPAP